MAWLFAGFASGPSAGAQEPAAPQPQLVAPMSVEVVRLEVVVTEKRRKPNAGLTREDFVILEEGKPQPIVQFQAFRRPGEGSRANPPRPPGEDEAEEQLLPARYVVLVIDDVHMEFDSLARLQKAIVAVHQDRPPAPRTRSRS